MMQQAVRVGTMMRPFVVIKVGTPWTDAIRDRFANALGGLPMTLCRNSHPRTLVLCGRYNLKAVERALDDAGLYTAIIRGVSAASAADVLDGILLSEG